MYDFASGAVNPLVTNFASKNWQDLTKNSLAARIAPIVMVDNSLFHYKKFADTNAFAVPVDTAFPASGDPNSIDFGVYDQAGTAQPQALKTVIRIDEKDAVDSGTSSSLLIEQSKISTLQQGTLLAHEKYVYDILSLNAPLQTGMGSWSSDASDPTKELDNLFVSMARNMGRMPNLVVTDAATFQKWRNNKNVIARAKYGVSQDKIDAAALIGYTLNPTCEVRIGTIARSTLKDNNSDKRANVFMSEGFLYVMYSNTAPSIDDESAFKNFMVQGSSMSNLRSYMHPNGLSWGHNIYWNRVVLPTNATYGSAKVAIS